MNTQAEKNNKYIAITSYKSACRKSRIKGEITVALSLLFIICICIYIIISAIHC